MITFILLIFFAIRLYTLYISIQHERALKAEGAKQHGVKNSKYLAITHTLIYVSAIITAIIQHPRFDFISLVGLILLVFSYIVLFMVIRTLGSIWTLKIYILKKHRIVEQGIFKYIKHPNYFLNIIPELIGVVLLTHAYSTALLFIPYALFLYIRIQQEEQAMAHLY
ncbi:isoprenylcysteine carboxyl methyltransferase family protein [Staphylococcus carnosus]|uniref:Membrane protein n=1 Tax=Staphylococcus carnosus (strain TM300) TaxID=396513 RepID=B9DLJ3_STACT|nr:isoprenylcysteine carboxyl methyltransferase family protein [Staphylococcus carnosus]QPT03194.1 isoprenylcysteine carboxyl methyltransferase family protein [Staphylococcus carnosus]UQA68197.1 isoprenylcysteine carboxyl methyltransferase family protein [Staphylococcus carnosus]UTB79240.1 hypothetical protein A2I62_12090 [Staphylococcus carnosus]UTB88792.1 hypothetical protein A2I63_12090 [Staphylococcus carnosus]UTB91141.1 hypothetical protein A2I64_12085 [Staphylococcus carnosus]